MEISQFAPVLIPTLNRYEHFHRCVESLSRCTHADKTDLYIALDYPVNDAHWEGYNKIKEYIDDISGFKTINIIKRDKNFGATENIRDAREQIFQKYDRIILSEDDNEFAPNFLDYINKGLDKFEDDPRIIAICGYSHPIDISEYNHNFFFRHGFSAWGYGITRSNAKFINSYLNIEFAYNLLKNINFINKLIKYNRYQLIDGLINIVNKRQIKGDTLISSLLIDKGYYSVCPKTSLVRNYGHDGTGANCSKLGEFNIYKLQNISSLEIFDFDEEINPQIDKLIESKMQDFLNISLLKKIRIIQEYLCFYLKNLIHV